MNPSSQTPKLLQLSGHEGRRPSNLALALFLLPQHRRKDAFLFHDFCRTVDDIADHGTLSTEQRRNLLGAWHAALQPSGEENLPVDFYEMIGRRQLDRHLLGEIVLGMQMDLDQNRYASFDELHHYCWRVASAVGLISASLFGVQGANVELYAKELGIALQLTNILRDVAEDAAMNRIYLPQEDLKRFGVDEREIFAGTPSPQMTHLLNHQAERADAYFAKAELSWSNMTKNQKRLMRPARLMSAIYRTLLLKMHEDRYDVFAKKYRVSGFRKSQILLHVITSKN